MGFTPPPYPYDRLEPMKAKAEALPGGAVDLSVGTPNDAPPKAVLEALATSNSERGYPASIGSAAYRQAAARWMQRRLGVEVEATQLAACVGTKEFVGTLPQYLHLRTPERDTILHPAIAYPTYDMGASLAGLRAVAVPVDEHWRLDLGAISEEDAERALALWVNTPGNPAGQLDDLGEAAKWGRAHHVPVFSDECYVEFTWNGEPRTILSEGTEGVVAVHSLSKRSNLAGARAGFYAGDQDLVTYLQEVRKHAGFMVPGPIQAAAVAALDDDDHVAEQRKRYDERLKFLAHVIEERFGIDVPLPDGGFYLWIEAPGNDAWGFAEQLAAEGGALVTPGDTFGPQGAGHVRIAMVQPMERLHLVAERLLHRSHSG
jgi:succinyldiaminopimelate transaminase